MVLGQLRPIAAACAASLCGLEPSLPFGARMTTARSCGTQPSHPLRVTWRHHGHRCSISRQCRIMERGADAEDPEGHAAVQMDG
jgi:hypothetical protein